MSSVCKLKLGVDGGGTKTELVAIDESGEVLARQIAPGCNPSIVGPDHARRIATDALVMLVDQARLLRPDASVTTTLLCMAGSPLFWNEYGRSLTEFGDVRTLDDSLPVLELATRGAPGLVLHGGTGSFVAARAPDGRVHYAGGLGWRFGDPGSGYDLGRRAVSRALLELQGWALPSLLGQLIRDHTGLADAPAVTRYFYAHADPNRQIAALAPGVLHLASEGEPAATELVLASAGELLDLALRVARELFTPAPFDTIRAGLSGPILVHPTVVATLAARSPLPLQPLTDAPIEGVRRLLLHPGP
ncbi:MAG TPA: BadF/BadG/BcrA/BcrD ATPase family protein [Candidatus Synoicihabitans sp.]|nr:BadF/BadG/BcrA/BcrD ATPase family protein [Candidatus Synoicihabitans sp.]